MPKKPLMIMDDRIEEASFIPVAASPEFELPDLGGPAATPRIGNFRDEPKEPPGKLVQFGKMLTGKFAMSILVTGIVTSFFNVDRLCKVAQFFCSAAKVFADPETTEKLKRLFGKGEEAAARVEKQVDSGSKPGKTNEGGLQKFAHAVTNNPAVEKAQQQVEVIEGKASDAGQTVKGAAEGAKDTAIAVKKTTEAVGDKIDNIGTALGNGAKAVGNGVVNTGKAIGNGIANMPRPTPPQMSHLPNAACPYCGHKMRLNTHNVKPFGCHGCYRLIYPRDAFTRFQRGGFR